MEKSEDAYLKQRIDEESSKIKVGSYQKIASVGGWAGGGRTLWAVAAIGAAAGAAIGVIAPFFPLLVGASSVATAIGAIGASVATFAAVGLGMGFSGGLVLGRISGVGASVAEEQEKRMKHWTTKQIINANPEAKIVEDEHDVKRVKAYKPFWQKGKDTYDTYVNPRVGLAFAAAGAVGGLIMAAAYVSTGGLAGAIMPALGAITGLGEAALGSFPVIAAYTAGITASFGALFSLNLPKIVSDLTEFTGKIVSGEKLGREWGPKQQKQQAPGEAPDLLQTRDDPETLPEPAQKKPQRKTSYRDRLEKENQKRIEELTR